LPRHGREAHLLARVVETLLDSQNRNYEAFTPITMDIPEEGGIEPDYCFYIDNWQAAVGKDRINWQIDPPPSGFAVTHGGNPQDRAVSPDLVIEIDVTSYTSAEDFLPYKVPEVWLFKKSGLSIYGLSENSYQKQLFSKYFPEIDLSVIIKQVLEIASQQGTGVAIRNLRQRLIVNSEQLTVNS
ncbi:MAG: Uma2 family endonuclease, partial [Rivularia sp. ALOHA_DT_140]|nr:Uma2 family endonuclease [Rivularia sp. ALOHA_DT_140]